MRLENCWISQAEKEITTIKKKMDSSYKDRRENTIARGWGNKQTKKQAKKD